MSKKLLFEKEYTDIRKPIYLHGAALVDRNFSILYQIDLCKRYIHFLEYRGLTPEGDFMLNSEFQNFNGCIKIGSESTELRSKRDMFKEDFKRNFPDKLNALGIEVAASEIEFVLQGSYKLNTTIKNAEESIDLDLGVIFPLNIEQFPNSYKIKEAAVASIEILNVRNPIIKGPCITVQYVKKGEDWLHLDFPLYAKFGDNLYLARGDSNNNSSWELCDPKGLNNYFLERLENSPQLRRIIRYLKYWKNQKYSSVSSKDCIPPSIGLTLLAVDVYEQKDTDLECFLHVMESIKDRFVVNKNYDGEIISAVIQVHLPVQQYSDVFNKFNRLDSSGIDFYKKLDSAINSLNNAFLSDNPHDAAKYVTSVLGDKFEIPKKEIKHTETKPRSEHYFG